MRDTGYLASPITRYKRKLISVFTSSPELIQLINSDYVKDGECVDTDDLIYKQIYPYQYIPTVQTDKMAYVTMKVNGLGIKDKLYTKVEVIIYAISDQDIMYVKHGNGTRIDMMGEIIEELLNGRDDFGFGELELRQNYEDNINNTHRCRVLRFIVEDFNGDACRNEVI